MLTVKVLGPGCANCARLKAAAVEALKNLGIEATLEYITDRTQFSKYGLLMTPGLVLNDKLVCAGRVPSVSEVTALIANMLAEKEAK